MAGTFVCPDETWAIECASNTKKGEAMKHGDLIGFIDSQSASDGNLHLAADHAFNFNGMSYKVSLDSEHSILPEQKVALTSVTLDSTNAGGLPDVPLEALRTLQSMTFGAPANHFLLAQAAHDKAV